MIQGIEFYFKPDQPVDYSAIRTPKIIGDFDTFISPEDKRVIDQKWSELTQQNPKVFSKERGLCTLCDFEDWTFLFTNYKDYSAISRTGRNRVLSLQTYSRMHVNSCNGAVRSLEGDVVVHKRLSNAPCVPDSYDCSVGGFAYVNEGELNFLANLYRALKRELDITPEQLAAAQVISMHSSRHPDYSAMLDFAVDTKLDTRQLTEKAKQGVERGVFQGFEIVSQKKLPDFIVDVYSSGDDICLDGCATLASSLPDEEFVKVIERLRKKGRRIEFGNLVNGNFIPDIANVHRPELYQ